MGKEAKLNKEKRGLRAEIVGIIFFALALLVSASLVCYHTGSESSVGLIGNNISWLLFIAIGLTAYVFPVLFLFIAYRMLFKFGVKVKVTIPVSLILFMSALSALVEVVLGGKGGIVGNFIARHLGVYLGSAGSIIVLGALILISLRVGTGLSLIQLGQGVAAVILAVAAFVASLVSAMAGRLGVVFGLLRKRRAEKATEKEKEKVKAEKATPEKEPRKKPPIITTKAIVKPKPKAPEQSQERFEFATNEAQESFKLPSISYLNEPDSEGDRLDKDTILTNSKILEKKLHDFDVDGHVVEVRPGPIVTTYEFEPAPGIKVGKITNLSDDLALAMRAESIRILAPVPGKAVVGIEIPNQERETILFREILECKEYAKSKSVLTFALGKDVSGEPFTADLAKMPHLLVAGATGAGKSVAVNAMILSILYKATPDDVRFLMIDPKMLELSAYEGIPHMLAPVVTNPKRASVMLRGIVTEMEKRYKRMAVKGAKNIDDYNEKIAEEEKEGKVKDTPKMAAGENSEATEAIEHGRLPYIVVIIDELADLMVTAGKDVEDSLVRLSQMARAAGIHLILATQRPSVDVLTGLIKANFPARISFQVPSRTDSRTILDSMGAETLLGNGDMLFLPPGSSKLKRVHGAYVSSDEIIRVTESLKKQGKPILKKAEIIDEKTVSRMEEEEDLGEEFMKKYREAVEMAEKLEMVSTSYIQRRFRIGYNTAARIVEKMEQEGIVGPPQGSKPREVLKKDTKE